MSLDSEGLSGSQESLALMREDTPTLEERTRPQFSLRALFVAVTAVSFVLGLGCWIGWLRVSGAIWTGVVYAQVGVTFWPAVVAMLWLNRAEAKSCGRWVLALGALFLLHFSAMQVEPGSTFHQQVTVSTLNWTVPSVAAGLSAGLYVGLTARSTLPYLVGCFLAALGLVGFVLSALSPANYPGLANSVWWL